MAQRDPRPSLAAAMYPNLSREAKAKAAEQTKAQQELRERSRRTAAHLDEVLESIRREREGR
jgi:hypothetical protein